LAGAQDSTSTRMEMDLQAIFGRTKRRTEEGKVLFNRIVVDKVLTVFDALGNPYYTKTWKNKRVDGMRLRILARVISIQTNG